MVDIAALVNPSNGGQDVLSYHIQYDDASQGTIWTDLVGLSSPSLALQTTVTSSIQVGKVYQFRYRAKNSFGFGPYSDPLYLYAARVAD